MRGRPCLPCLLVCGAAALVPGEGRVRRADAREELLDPLERLELGNQRYRSGQAAHFNQDRDRRADLAQAQHPFALVVGCADSSVPPEIVFDQGLGELYVVRCAGEALDDLGLASVEYAVGELGVRTIIVLGHERCGAVQAALEGAEPAGHGKYLARAIGPRIEAARRAGVQQPLDEAVRLEVRAVVSELEACEPVLSELQHTGELRVVGALYDLDSGAVEWLRAPAR